jgi:DNA-binding beta-propeller fold protein YncE
MRSFATAVFALFTCAPAIAFADGPVTPAPSPNYQVTDTFKVGGDGRWDYVNVDPASHLLFVTRQTHTQIIREQTGVVVADLKDTPGAHGVAVASELNRGFVSDGKGNTVTVFDLKTFVVLDTVKTGQNPDSIIYDPASKMVFAFDGKSNDATVIDAAAAPDHSETKPAIALDGKPEFAAADGQGHVYVNIEDKSEVQVISTVTMKVTETWKIEGGQGPSGMAIDPTGHHLFCGCDDNQVMAVIDTQTGKTLGTVPIGKNVDACAFDPMTGEAFASCGDGTLTVVKETSPGKFEAVEVVKTRPGARTMGLDPVTDTIYLPTAEFDTPAADERRPNPKAGTFMIVVVSQVAK